VVCRSLLCLLLVACTARSQWDEGEEGPAVPVPLESSIVENWHHASAVALDLLLVIDDSCSMSAQQDALSLAVPELLAELEDASVHYRIGVTTTDTDGPHAGLLRAAHGEFFVTSRTPNPGLVLSELVLAGNAGSGNERGLDAIAHAISPELSPANGGFYRSSAHLVAVVISDEDDFSALDVSEFTTWFSQLKRGRAAARFHAVADPLGKECRPDTALDAPDRYLAVAEQLDGCVISLCDPSWIWRRSMRWPSTRCRTSRSSPAWSWSSTTKMPTAWSCRGHFY